MSAARRIATFQRSLASIRRVRRMPRGLRAARLNEGSGDTQMAKSSAFHASCALAALSMLVAARIALAADTAAPRLPSGVPDFSSHDMGWASDGVEFFPVPGEKFKPVTN